MIDGGLNWACEEVTATASNRNSALVSDRIILIFYFYCVCFSIVRARRRGQMMFDGIISLRKS